jgi:beta-fructofuranosidase
VSTADPDIGVRWAGSAAQVVGDPTADAARLDRELRAFATRAVEGRPATIDTDPWRQSFHIQPPIGLLNDPNGLVQHRGTYHLCYQWHPFGARHALKFWAHLTSTDLVHWTEQPIALAPSQPYESHGCYSGSGIVHEDAVKMLYTGNSFTPEGQRTPYQLLATLDPQGGFVKHHANPIVAPIDGYAGDIRDPKVWFRADTYWMLLGARGPGDHGTALLLRSTDLVDWELIGPIAGGADEPLGYMWECPDLPRLDDRDVLVISPQFDAGEHAGDARFTDTTLYCVGALDLASGRFTGHEFRRVDAGPDFYAPQSLVAEDGRVIQVAWMGMPDHPGQPDIAVKHPTVANGWVHCLTVPRELGLDGQTLVQRPVAELAQLRGEPVRAEVTIGAGDSTALPGVSGAALDLELRATCAPGAVLSVRLREGDAGRPVILTLDPHTGTATLDRTQLGTGEGGVFTGSFRPGTGLEARILLDHSSIEVFVDGGRLAMSARIYPQPAATGIAFDATGGDVRLDVTCHPMAAVT